MCMQDCPFDKRRCSLRAASDLVHQEVKQVVEVVEWFRHLIARNLRERNIRHVVRLHPHSNLQSLCHGTWTRITPGYCSRNPSTEAHLYSTTSRSLSCSNGLLVIMHRQWQCWALEVSARRHLGSVAHGLVFLVAQCGEGVADNTCGGASPWLSSGGQC